MTNIFPKNSNFFNTLQHLNNLRHNPFSGKPIFVNTFNHDLISFLRIYVNNISYEEQCPICLCLIRNPTRPSNCRHTFCNYCIKQWFHQSKKCPVCRKEFSSLIGIGYCSLLYQRRRFK